MATTGTIYDETVKFGPAKLLVAATISSPVAFASFPTVLSTEFAVYHIDIMINVGTAGAYLCAQTTDNGGVGWTTTYYQTIGYYTQTGGGGDSIVQGTTAQLQMSHACYNGLKAEMMLFSRGGTGNQGHSNCCYAGPAYGLGHLYGSGGYASVTGVRFYFSSGNIASGFVRVYGMRSGA